MFVGQVDSVGSNCQSIDRLTLEPPPEPKQNSTAARLEPARLHGCIHSGSGKAV
jgi:hypothetical protein